MHEYDTVLKALLQGSANSILEEITGVRVVHWLNVELPEVQATRVDLLGQSEGPDEELIHVELQSSNDSQMPLRMAEYSLRVYRLFQRFPRQILLYVGAGQMQMPAELAGPDHFCRYYVSDIRDLDSERFLNSPYIADNVLAILTRLRDSNEAVRQILERIATLMGEERGRAFKQFLILSGLRNLEAAISEEATHMPVLNDILDHKVIGPAIRQGLAEGLRKGLDEGRQQGRQEGRWEVLRQILEARFGSLPQWAVEKLIHMPEADMNDLTSRVLVAPSLEDLLKQ